MILRTLSVATHTDMEPIKKPTKSHHYQSEQGICTPQEHKYRGDSVPAGKKKYFLFFFYLVITNFEQYQVHKSKKKIKKK